MPGDLQKLKQSQADKSNALTLSNGIVLTIRKVSYPIMIDILHKAQEGRPRPPVTYIEHLGRNEENPDDPDYKEAINTWNTSRGKILSDNFLKLGTKLFSCPPDIPKPDDQARWNEWMDDLEGSGFQTPKSAGARYLMWLKLVALVNDEDYTLVIDEVGKKTGVREADAQAAMESFRSDAEREPVGAGKDSR